MSSNYEQITQLDITRKNSKYWVYQINGEVDTRASSKYTGTKDGDYIYIKTETGASQAMQVPFSVIKYYDVTDPSKNMTNPGSSDELFAHLLNEDFFPASSGSSSGGTGGVNTFLELLDVLFPTYAGRNGQAVVVQGNGLTTAQILNTILGASDFLGPLLPGRFLVTSANVNSDEEPIGVVTADPINVINRPPAFGEIQVIRKGYVWDGSNVSENVEPYTMEIGDICSGMFYVFDIVPFRVVYMEAGRWNGGDIFDLNSYTITNGPTSFSFPTDPDYIN